MQNAALALVGLASLLVGFVFRLIAPDLRWYAWGILAVGVALLAIAVALDFRRVKGALGSRRGRFGVGATVKLALALGIVLLVNAISAGSYLRIDATGLAQFTLTSQTKEVLAKLDKPVEVVSFFTPSVPAETSGYAGNLLAEYQKYSGLLTVRNVDPDLNPDQARQYLVDQFGAQYGVVVFRSAAGMRQVYGPQISAEAEHAFTSAILEVTGTRQKKVYFLTGHGESSIMADYSAARSGLRDNLYQVDELDLTRTPRIPDDAAALIMAGPQRPPASSEMDLLKAYLDGGGRVFLLLNPGAPQALRQLATEWGLTFEDGTIIDPGSYVAPQKDDPLVTRDRNHFGLAQVYFPGVAAVLPQKELPKNVSILPLAWTTAQSWLARSLIAGKEPSFDKSVDIKGPLAVGALISTVSAAGTGETSGMRLIVIGDSDFAANTHFPDGNNGDMFLSGVSWLTEGEEIVSVDRKVLPVRRLVLSPEEARFLQISSIGLLPLLLLLLAGLVAWRRR